MTYQCNPIPKSSKTYKVIFHSSHKENGLNQTLALPTRKMISHFPQLSQGKWPQPNPDPTGLFRNAHKENDLSNLTMSELNDILESVDDKTENENDSEIEFLDDDNQTLAEVVTEGLEKFPKTKILQSTVDDSFYEYRV